MSTITGGTITETLQAHWDFIKEQARQARVVGSDLSSDWHPEPQEDKLDAALKACSDLTYAINNYRSLLEAVSSAVTNHAVIERREVAS